ncbi:hypothetical protein [Clostridium sp.]|uniref:hypothetical protein n=1 Tax=Clostridium sp. TaxID=1506 RepID=UPI0025BF127C|nr:hypothetical protein [Clostridium sp.]
MIVKCNCDCKYCEEGICSKEEIIICDTGEGMNCIQYELPEDSFLNRFEFDWYLDDNDCKYVHVILASVFITLGEVAKYMFETYPLENIDCDYYIFDTTLTCGSTHSENRFIISEAKGVFETAKYSKKSAYVKNSCEMIRDYKLYDHGILTSAERKMIAHGINI